MTPMVAALGDALDDLPDIVRAHLSSCASSRWRAHFYRGYARGLLGWIAARLLRIEREAAFVLENEMVGEEMIWRRTLDARVSEGKMRFSRGKLVDRLGRFVEVELDAKLRDGAFEMRARRVRVFGVDLPRLLVGGARTREWQEGDRLALALDIEHPVFGSLAGHEAHLEEVTS